MEIWTFQIIHHLHMKLERTVCVTLTSKEDSKAFSSSYFGHKPATVEIMADFQAAVDPMVMQLLLDSNTEIARGEVPFELILGLLLCIVSALLQPDAGPRLTQKRMYWVFPRTNVVWDTVHKRVWTNQAPRVRDREWRKTYRMFYPHYLLLVNELTPFLSNPTGPKSRFREPIEPDRVVAMVLYRLAHGYAPEQVANLYGVGKSTLIFYTKLITRVLSQDLYSKYISIPSGERLLQIINEFKQLTGLDNMCGAVDGSHIKLWAQPPNKNTPADYWCRHHIHSILLQGVCTAGYLFWDVSAIAPGGTHDATHLRSSSLFGKLNRGQCLVEPRAIVGDHEFRPYIVGDSAYPLLSFLLKPFTAQGTGTVAQNSFDKDMRKGRVKIENTFGQLKGRFHILRNLNVGLQYAGQTIVACCVLHNFCGLKGEGLEEVG